MNGCGKTTVLELITDLILSSMRELVHNVEVEVVIETQKDNHLTGFKDTLKDKFYMDSNVFRFSLETKTIGSLLRFYRFNDAANILGGFAYLPIKKKTDISKIIKTYTPVYLLHLESHKTQMAKNVLKAVQTEVYKNRNLTLNDSIQKSLAKISHVLRYFE